MITRAIKKLAAWHYTRNGMRNINQKRTLDDLSAEPNQTITWPYGKRAAFNLQFDDANPKPGPPYDFGGNPSGEVRGQLNAFLADYPFVHVDLFIIADAIFKGDGESPGTYPAGQWAIDNHPEFCTYIQDHPQLHANNHGLHHYQDAVSYFLQAREFEFKSAEQARAAIIQAQVHFTNAGFKPAGFKPSGWGIGHNANFGLIDALKTCQFDYVCLSSPVSGLNWEARRVSNLYPEDYCGLVNIPQNISLNWPLEQILATVDTIVQKGGVVTPQGHMIGQDKWMADGIGPRTIDTIRAIVDHLEARYAGEIYYGSLADIYNSVAIL